MQCESLETDMCVGRGGGCGEGGWFQEVTLFGWINSGMELDWTWGWHLVCEPWHRRHRLGNSFCECSHLSLQVNQEGVRPPSPSDFDSAIVDMVLMEGRGTP